MNRNKIRIVSVFFSMFLCSCSDSHTVDVKKERTPQGNSTLQDNTFGGLYEFRRIPKGEVQFERVWFDGEGHARILRREEDSAVGAGLAKFIGAARDKEGLSRQFAPGVFISRWVDLKTSQQGSESAEFARGRSFVVESRAPDPEHLAYAFDPQNSKNATALGKKQIDGHMCEGWRVTFAPPNAYRIATCEIWMTPQYRIPLFFELATEAKIYKYHLLKYLSPAPEFMDVETKPTATSIVEANDVSMKLPAPAPNVIKKLPLNTKKERAKNSTAEKFSFDK